MIPTLKTATFLDDAAYIQIFEKIKKTKQYKTFFTKTPVYMQCDI